MTITKYSLLSSITDVVGDNSGSKQRFSKAFLESTNVLRYYPTDLNLREVMRKRGDLIDESLRSLGCRLDHRFPSRVLGERTRVGFLLNVLDENSTEYLGSVDTILGAPPETEVSIFTFDRGTLNTADFERRNVVVYTLPPEIRDQAEFIRLHDLDILVVVANVAAVASPACLLAAHRIARKQVIWCGSPITTGLRTSDYFVSGWSADSEDQYTEQLLKIPHRAPIAWLAEKKPSVYITRRSLGLSKEDHVYVSLANYYKLNEDLLNTWKELLDRDPQGYLILAPFGKTWSDTYPEQAVENSLQKRLGDRCKILRISGTENCRDLLIIADLVLDSFPYASFTSLIDAVAVHKPFLTTCGSTLRSNLGIPIAHSVGHPEWVVKREEYVDQALRIVKEGLAKVVGSTEKVIDRFFDPERTAAWNTAFWNTVLGTITEFPFQMSEEDRKLWLENLSRSAETALEAADWWRAIQIYTRILAQVKSVNALIARGACFRNLLRFEDAENDWKMARDLAPDNWMVWNNLGCVYGFRGRSDLALEAQTKARELAPPIHAPSPGSYSLYSRLTLCDDAYKLKSSAVEWAKARNSISTKLPHFNVRIPDRKLRVGFIGPDFRDHSVMLFLYPLLCQLDRDQIQPILYPTILKEDRVLEATRTVVGGENWRPLQGLSEPEMARQINADGIDILIDLAGHTDNSGLPVLSFSPAPIQGSYLGFPGTTGLELDFRIGDEYTDPVGSESHYTEKNILRMKGRPYLCFGHEKSWPEVQNRTPGSPVTFGSFNALTKVTESVLDCWSEILKKVPNSKLIMKGHGFLSQACIEDFTARFAKRGIPSDRIDLRPWAKDRNSHLVQYHEVDISLDTFPYNGTTTTCESLWMGVPVMTKVGNCHHSRNGLSVLMAVGPLAYASRAGIAETEEEYVALAVEAASFIDQIRTDRKNLREVMRRSPLCNVTSLARQFEEYLQSLWLEYCRVEVSKAE